MNRAIGPVFQQWRALTLGCLQISHRDGRHMRQPVELWAKQKQTARSAFQLWELGGRRESVLRCSVAQKAGHVVQKSHWNGDLCVMTSTEDTLLRELELDRPCALGGHGPRPSFCSGAVDHSWAREAPLSLIHSDMCAGSTPTCDDSAVVVVFLRLLASAHSHVHKGNVTAAFLQGRDTELERGLLAQRGQELSETRKVATVECLQLRKAV